MGSEHITLRIGSAASLTIDTGSGDEPSEVRIVDFDGPKFASTDGLVIHDENSPLIIQVRWKNATSTQESRKAVLSAENFVELQHTDQCEPLTVRSVVNDRLTQLVTAEFQRLKQRSIADGRTQYCTQHLQQLSAKEIDVLILMIEGSSCKEIATHLRIGLATVAKHRMRILKKLNVRDTVELVQILLAVCDGKNSLANLAETQDLT